jgi:hypothetical protein
MNRVLPLPAALLFFRLHRIQCRKRDVEQPSYHVAFLPACKILNPAQFFVQKGLYLGCKLSCNLMTTKHTNWLCSIIVNLATLILPFAISIVYNEAIPMKTINIALGMYFMTVATSVRNMALFFVLLFLSISMLITYGAIKQDVVFVMQKDMFGAKALITYVITILLISEKYQTHVVNGLPFLSFKVK